MKLPKHIINKIIKVNDLAYQQKNLMNEVEQWLENKGIDVGKLRESTLSVLELADYGEYDGNHEAVERDLLDNIEETR